MTATDKAKTATTIGTAVSAALMPLRPKFGPNYAESVGAIVGVDLGGAVISLLEVRVIPKVDARVISMLDVRVILSVELAVIVAGGVGETVGEGEGQYNV
jgi:hypothetical protein